ncbi:hypothetical protein N7448_006572 [Penicillium atrosanguineum]|nr:uncharacterized protein N7443_010334 [Penicillium atrosanguineum]KAJ5132414.1 hypothetical protein N7448_006572 [Penicillium atrosanguineum]KAJ5137373.1 hypothetical protein N7526_003606 [Penicillium atrosanguineum]KAJ5290081.1 hypothetical protein N7443_010334 [Penicillium atrosanguineum]
MDPATEPDTPVEAWKVLPNNTHESWVKDRGLRRLNLGIALMFASSAGTGYNGSLINGLLVLPQFSNIIGGLNPNIVGLIIGATSLGAFISFTPASYVADKFGRKWCVVIGSSIVIIASILQVATSSHWAFFALRVLAGAGVGTSQTAAPLLATEIAHPRHRQVATALYNAFWCVGSITSAAFTFATLSMGNSWSWKIPCVLQAFFPVAQLVGLLIVPESPRWLVSKNRKNEALKILARYHANGNEDDILVQSEFEKICTSINAETSEPRKWSSFFSSKGDRHRLAICVIVGLMQEWAGNGIVSFYLSPILKSVGIEKASDQASINISMQVWNLILSSVGAMASERYGRRILWLMATAGMLMFLSITTLVAGLFAELYIKAAGLAVVPMLFLFFACFDLAYSPLFLSYPAEILPFQLRAKGIAVTLSVDAIACFFNQYVNPVAFSAIHWKYYIVYIGCLSFFLVSVYFLFPETKGRSLEEVSRIFDSSDIQGVEFRDSSTSTDEKEEGAKDRKV